MLNSSSTPDYDVIRCLSVPLAEKLQAYSKWQALSQPEFKLLNDRLFERLAASGAAEGALRSGAPLLPFTLPDSDGRLVSTGDCLKSGPLIVSFNRGYWCPYCRLELLALEEIFERVKKLGGTIISITPQRAPAANQLKEMCETTFSMLCDIDNGYALECGLMMSIGEAFDQAFREFGVDLATDQGNDGQFLPIPATYVVGQDGLIVADYVHPDIRKRMAPEKILDALESLIP